VAEGSGDISIDIVLKEQVKPALDALSGGIAEFTKTLSILTAQAKSAGDAIGKAGDRAEQVGQKVAAAVKPSKDLTEEQKKLAKEAKEAADRLDRFGVVLSADSPRIRANSREVEALVSSYARFKQAITNNIVAYQNQRDKLRSLKDAFADLRGGLNDTVGALTSFKSLAIAAVAAFGVFKAKSFIEGIVNDAAKLDETLRKAAAAVGSLNDATTEKLREDLKRLSIEEGADIRSLAEAAVGVIPDVGEAGIAEFLKVAQRFSEVAGGNVSQIADTLVFIIKGFGDEAENSSKSMAELASTISDKLFVAAREGNIAIGQLTGIVGLAAQQAEVLGISFDELLAAFTALGDVGVKPMRAFRVLSGVLAGVQEPSVKVVEAVERVNRAVPNLNLDFSRTGLAADGLAKFLGKLTIALKADEDLAKDLGINIREMGLIFKATANEGKALADQLANIQNSGGEVNRAADFILEGTEGKLRRISAIFAALKDDIAQVFIPAIDEFLGNFKNGIEGFRNSFGGSLSAIRQAVSEVQRSNLTDDQKKVALATLGDLQREVNKAGLTILVEALKVAFVAGGKILADLIFAAFAKGGLVLKNLILEALGKESASTKAARLEATQSAIQRTLPQVSTLPEAIPSQKQASDLFFAVAQALRAAQSISSRQAIPSEGLYGGAAAQNAIDNRVLTFAKDLAQAVKDAVGQLSLDDRKSLADSGGIDLLTNEVVNLQRISQDQPELFKQIVAAVLRTQGEILKQNNLVGFPDGINFDKRTNLPKLAEESRTAETNLTASSTEINRVAALTADFRLVSAGFIDGIRSIAIALQEGFGTGGAGFGTARFNQRTVGGLFGTNVPTTQIQGTFSEGESSQQAALLEIIQRAGSKGFQFPQLDSLRSLVQKGDFGGASRADFEQQLRDAQAERAEEEAVVREFIDSAIQRAADTAQGLSRVIGELGKAQTKDELQSVLENLGEDAGQFAPLVQGFIDLRKEGDDVVDSLTKIGEQFGFVAVKGKDGLITLERVSRTVGGNVAAAQSNLTDAATAAVENLIDTSGKVGTLQQRIAEQVGDSALNLAKRFAQVEIERRKAVGSIAETAIADQITNALKEADDLKNQIAALQDEKTANTIGKDEAAEQVRLLRERLSAKTKIIFEFVPDASAIFKSVEDIGKRIDTLRARAAGIKVEQSILPPIGAEQKQTELRLEASDINNQLQQAAKDYANTLITLVRSADRVTADEAVNVIRATADKAGDEAEKLVIEVAKRAAKLNQDALRTIFKNEAGAKQSEAIVAELDRLVTAKADATAKGLTAEVDALNKDIAGKIATLLGTLQNDVPEGLKDAFNKIVARLQSIQTATGEGAKGIIEQSRDELSDIIKVLFATSQKLGADLAAAQDQFRISEEKFKQGRESRSQTVRVGEVVSQRLAIGPVVPAGNQSLLDQSAGGIRAAFEASQQAGREIDFLIDKIKTLEGQLDSVRSLEVGAEDEPKRQALINQIEGIISGTQSLLQTKLANAGVPFVADDALSRTQSFVDAQLELLRVQQEQVPVLEIVRKAIEDQAKAQEKLVNSQKLAAAAGTNQYATLAAVYGTATFQIDQTKGSIEQQRQALTAYISQLQSISATLEQTLQLNPDLAGDIQPAIDEVKEKLVAAQVDLDALGRGWGDAFGKGFKQGLGAVETADEFLANLGRGAGQALQSNLGTAIDSVIDGTKSLGEAFKEFVASTLIDIGKLIIKMLILQAIQSALGGLGLFNEGGVVPEPVELNRGGVVPELRQPRRWNGYNTGGSVDNDDPKPPSRGIMARIKAAVARIKPSQPEPQPVFVRAYAEGGFVGADPLSKAIHTIVNVLTPQPVEPRFYETGGFVARKAEDTPRIDRVVRTISNVFDSSEVQHLNSGGRVEESGVGKALKAIASVLQPQEPDVLALAGGGVAYLAVGGFPANAPRRKGRVPGPDVNRDVVPAMLTPGEFVMKRSAVSNYGLGVMYAMNEGLVPKDMFGSLPGVRKLATGGTAEATIPPKIEVSAPMQPSPQMPQQSGTQAPVPAYIVANEQAMQSLLNGGRNAMIDFMRRNKSST
jgi:TP901 family phage tail tape measure protein